MIEDNLIVIAPTAQNQADLSRHLELSPEDRQKILFDWNNTQNDFSREKTLATLIEEQVAKNPESIALMFQSQTMTYQELNARANQLARYLQNEGVRSGELIAICLRPSFELIIAILAVLKAGCAYVPLDPNYPIERRIFMLEDTQATMLLTNIAYKRQFKKQNIRITYFDQEFAALSKQSEDNLNTEISAENLAYVIYTSGSTGKPKGVMITQHNVHHFINWFKQALSVSNDDIFDFSSSISFDFSVATTIFPLVIGASVAICSEGEKKDPNLYLSHIQKNNVSVIKITPSYFRQLKEFINHQHHLEDLRWIVFGGELLLVQDIKEWLHRFPKHTVLNEYGPTEAAVATSWITIDKANIDKFERSIPIGKAAFNCQLYILDTNLNPVPIGVEGELYIGGEGVAQGYLNRQKETQQRFIKNMFVNDENARLYRTGDLCRYLPDGNIEFIGRVDHQIKIRGFRIETAEIEMRLTALESINEVVVLAMEDADQSVDKRLIAYCLLKDPAIKPDVRYLRQYLLKSLPEYMIPNAFVLMEKFPINTNGKLDRRALPLPEQDMWHHYRAPRNSLEQIIADIWSEALNLKMVGIDENFFELGGHSLSAARIISKIIKVTHKEIKLTDLYDAPTIRELVRRVSQAKEDNNRHPKVHRTHTHSDAKIPLSNMQLILWLAQKTYSKNQGLNIVARKRINGNLDTKAIHFAFTASLKIHEILRYNISSLLPVMYPQKKVKFHVEERDLRNESLHDQEKILAKSVNYFKKYNKWKKGSSLIRARLFQLSGDKTELQISMAHLISDEISPEIIFEDLSKYYQEYVQNKDINYYQEQITFKDYAHEERENLEVTLKKDIPFWRDYLADICLYKFPKKAIVDNPDQKELYSTFIDIPEILLKRIQAFCAQNHLSVTDCLSAAVGLALTEYVNHASGNSIALNLVKSTRLDESFDHTIGFFVTTDIIKMPANEPTLAIAAKHIQKSVLETASHQFCPVIVKFAYLFQHGWKDSRLLNLFINQFSRIIKRIFPALKLNDSVLSMYGKVLAGGMKNQFIVQINVLNNFINHDYHADTHMFGYPIEKLSNIKDERMVAKNILDITFERDNSNSMIVLSGNLSTNMREKIGKHIISELMKL